MKRMASGEEVFPPQSQQQQPGKEHMMHPVPQAMNPDYKPSNKLHGKVALVIGGDSGIGRAVCYQFVLGGATIAFTYVKGIEEKDKEDTLQLLLAVKASGVKDPIAITADVGFDENCKRVIDDVASEYGRIDILVNNAAEQHLTTSMEEITEPRLERALFEARERREYIINWTSVDAYAGGPEVLDYTATDGAIVAFTRGLALQLGNRGIRINAVASGPVWTPLQTASMPPEMVKSSGSQVPMGRAAQPHEIAPSYVFLTSDDCSSYFTGQVLHPNGGVIVNA